jgi:anti-sigma-K factor RskA
LIYGNHIAEENLSLYAVRALGPNENADVQRHLDTCAKCRSRLAEVISGLSIAALTAPQEHLLSDARERILDRIKAEDAAAPAMDIRLVKAREPQPAAPAPSNSRPSRLAWIVAGIAIILAAYFGTRERSLQQQIEGQRYQIVQLSRQSLRAEQVVDLLRSRSAQRLALMAAKTPAEPTAQVIYDKSRAALIFIASNLRPVPADKTYQLWLVPASGIAPISSGLFRPDTNGSASIVLPPLSEGIEAKTFDVTIEEAQGALSPTMPAVLSGP